MTDMPKEAGRVALVGAGPGDAGLLTLKGKEWLERADVVVYDHLANWNLLRFAPGGAERIYAGKAAGQATLTQEAINALLIEKARQGKTVVRLKGGDPFIFGRGGEEAQALNEAGVAFVVVPGISSPIGVSAYAGIPLTHRNYSSSVSIITATYDASHDGLRIDWEKIASRSGTLVFLMGARKLPEIVANLTRFGKDPGTPVAVVQWGTTSRQKTWTGTLETIVDIAMREKIAPPALTIIGEVVNLRPLIQWCERMPLFGKTIVVTRAEDQSASFIQALEDKGAEPFCFPVIRTVPPEDWAPLDRALGHLASYHGLIFTSVNGVRFFMQRLIETGGDIRELRGVRVYAIGPQTALRVKELGIPVDVVPENFVAESLLDSLAAEGGLAGRRFLLPRAAVAREILPDTLRKRGAHVDVVPAYQTLRTGVETDALRKRLEDGAIDAITFTSSSTVTNFLELAGPSLRPLLADVKIACIGPITAETARAAGLNVAIVPDTFTVAALVAALEQQLRG